MLFDTNVQGCFEFHDFSWPLRQITAYTTNTMHLKQHNVPEINYFLNLPDTFSLYVSCSMLNASLFCPPGIVTASWSQASLAGLVLSCSSLLCVSIFFQRRIHWLYATWVLVLKNSLSIKNAIVVCENAFVNYLSCSNSYIVFCKGDKQCWSFVRWEKQCWSYVLYRTRRNGVELSQIFLKRKKL